MQWKTESVVNRNSWQGRNASAILLGEGDDNYDVSKYGVQDLVRIREGGQACRNCINNMAQGTDAGPTACGANGGTMVCRVLNV